MTFKNPSSQLIHSSLMFYIQHPNPKALHYFQKRVLKANSQALMERNADKHSHLENIIMMVAESDHSQSNKELYTYRLIKVLMKVCSDNLLVSRHFLLSKDVTEANVLDKILLIDSSAHLRLYFNEMKAIIIRDPLSREHYRKIHLEQSADNLTFLMKLLQTVSSSHLELYLEELRNCVTESILSLAEYEQLLIEPNKALFSPLHYVIMNGGFENLEIYFKELRHAVSQEMISHAAYGQLLIHRNIGGFTPLLGLLFNGNLESLTYYFGQLQDAVTTGIISRIDYGRLLIQANNAGFTPINQAIKTNHFESLRFYCEKLSDAFMSRSISVDAYRRALTEPNRTNFTPLLQAFKAGDTKIISFYLEVINKAYKANILSGAQLFYLLTSPTNKGFSPLHDILNIGEPVNLMIYIDELFFALSHKIIVPDDFCQILAQKNHENSSLLHFSARSGQFKMVNALFTVLERYLSKKVLLDLFNARNTEGLLARCNLKNPEALIINSFLNDKRQELELYLKASQVQLLHSISTLSSPSSISVSVPNVQQHCQQSFMPPKEYDLFSSTKNPFDVSEEHLSTIQPHLCKSPDLIYQSGFSLFSKPLPFERKSITPEYLPKT